MRGNVLQCSPGAPSCGQILQMCHPGCFQMFQLEPDYSFRLAFCTMTGFNAAWILRACLPRISIRGLGTDEL
jgi:hypothetical protein